MAKVRRAKNPDTPEAKAKYYVTNAKLLPEVLKAKAGGRVTEELGKMLMMIARNYARHPFFSGWSFKEDMISEALINLCQNSLKFNPEKSNNPFAFYTTCVHHSFLQFLNTERKHRNIRDKMLIEMGENPSYNYLENNANRDAHVGEYRAEVVELGQELVEARARQKKQAEDEAAKKAKEAAEAATLAAAERDLAAGREVADLILFTATEEVILEDSTPEPTVLQYDTEE